MKHLLVPEWLHNPQHLPALIERRGLLPLVADLLILVANSKKGEMILFAPASEDQRNGGDAWVETPISVGENRLERIRHQYPCWVWAYRDATLQLGFVHGLKKCLVE